MIGCTLKGVPSPLAYPNAHIHSLIAWIKQGTLPNKLSILLRDSKVYKKSIVCQMVTKVKDGKKKW